MLLLFGRFLMESAAERRNEALDRGLAAADQVADALDREFQSLSTMLAVFASSGWIEDEEYARLYLRAKTALAGTDTYLILLDEDLRQTFNTRVAYGLPLNRTSDPESARRAIETGQPVVSNIFKGQVADTNVFNLVRPVKTRGAEPRVLILTRNASTLGKVVEPSFLPPEWSYAILDSSGRIAASGPSDDTDEARAPPEACAYRGAQPPQLVSDTAVFAAIQRLTASDWSVCVWTPYATLEAPIFASLRTFSIATVGMIVVALVAAALLGRIVVRGAARAARVAHMLEEGGEITHETSFVAELDDVLQLLQQVARERAAREEELKLLLGETAHRAKNQIAVASSLVRLSAASADSVGQLRDDLTARFVALSRSVDMLVGRNWQTVSLAHLVEAQLKPFVNGRPDRLRVGGEDIAISPAAAQNLGLVMNELATNASKYGAWSNAQGKVAVEWSRQGEVLAMSWTETGGPPPAEPAKTGFGSRLIEALIVRSLSGEFSRTFGRSGLTSTLSLPLDAIRA